MNNSRRKGRGFLIAYRSSRRLTGWGRPLRAPRFPHKPPPSPTLPLKNHASIHGSGFAGSTNGSIGKTLANKNQALRILEIAYGIDGTTFGGSPNYENGVRGEAKKESWFCV